MDPSITLLTTAITSTITDSSILKTILGSLIKNTKKQEKGEIKVSEKDNIITIYYSADLTDVESQKKQVSTTIDEILRDADENTPNETSESFLLKWIEETRIELKLQREEKRKEASIAFYIALAALVTGILLAFTGVIFIFAINLSTGVVTAAAGIITDVVCALAFAFNKEANNRLVKITDEMGTLDKTNIAMQYISKIGDQQIKDKAIQDLAQSIYKRNL